jgi:SAM-dependent methyltransferase
MRRLHLFEFEDLTWFPSAIREAMTDFLSFMGAVADKPLGPFADRLERAMRITGDDRLLDLGSGGGGPALTVARLLTRRRGEPVKVTLTDLYPNLPKLELARREGHGQVTFVEDSVDATRVPSELDGFRLMCNAFHHLPPRAARQCLLDAVEKRHGIALVEFVDRSAFAVLQISLGLAAMLLVTPFIRPRRLSRFLFTYAIPIVPLCTWWDGFVSCLRAYDEAELKGLVESLPANDYEWEVGRLKVPMLPGALTYLVGHPPRPV